MSASFPARHPGRCHADCGEWIDRGDLIRMTDAGAVHDDCSDPEAGSPPCAICRLPEVEHRDRNGHRFTPHMCASTLPPACPKCWLHHAGECDR